MAAISYFLGARSGKSKKTGNWWGCVRLLTMDAFGQWDSIDIFCQDESVFEMVELCSLGQAVACSSWMNKLVGLEPLDDPPALPLLSGKS